VRETRQCGWLPGANERPCAVTVRGNGSSNGNDYRPPVRPDEAQKDLLKLLQQRIAGCAEELGLAAEIIAPKKELSAAVTGDRSGRVFKGWRAELIGNELLELLDD
jgi:ribonuclease D